MDGVTFVVPVRNGAPWIRATLDAIAAQADGRPIEIIVVDDRSRDDSAARLRELARTYPLRIVDGEGRGAAAAINAGVRAATHPVICQVDQDVVVQPGWMRRLVEELEDPEVAAAQGYYATDPAAPFFARAMNLDLEQRYAAIDGCDTDHVCTGNAAYRAAALRRVGLFDETFGYGYDNDLSYRLRAAGYRLTFCREARSVHRWREGLPGYLAQQYGFGYGRLDLVAKHPRRVSGDAVSPSGMMAHPVVMAAALAGLVAAAVLAAAGGPWAMAAAASAALVAGLALERLAAGVAAARRFRDLAPLAFPPLHLVRDLAWVAAMAMWLARRMAGRPPRPSDSMRPRRAVDGARGFSVPGLQPPTLSLQPPLRRTLCLIPAHNEAASLGRVVAEVKACRPDLDVLVIDDGSTDATPWLLDAGAAAPGAIGGIRWLRFPERLGIGSAMRAGLRYAARLGYDAAVRVDGDGQHRAEDIDRLLASIEQGRADVVLGSRYAQPDTLGRGPGPIAQRMLAACLSALTRVPVTDATSGFCAVGARAMRVLAEHHPTGYPEPELRLFLSRNGLTVVEVPVRARFRLAGTTSLTAVRIAAACARIALALIIVPFRGRVGLAGE
jgi:hypothetical protein